MKHIKYVSSLVISILNSKHNIKIFNEPGAMVTTLMPCLARSLAMGNVMPTTPALEAE